MKLIVGGETGAGADAKTGADAGAPTMADLAFVRDSTQGKHKSLVLYPMQATKLVALQLSQHTTMSPFLGPKNVQ